MRKFLTILVIMFMSAMLFSCSNNTNGDDQPKDPKENKEEKIDPDYVVIIKDAQLEKLIREEIKKADGDLTAEAMLQLEWLSIRAEETPVYELDGLEYASNLSYFSYSDGNLKSLTPISKLANLGKVTISYATVEEQSESFITPELYDVTFIDTNVSDLSFLSGATSVTNAIIDDCSVTSIEFLTNWENIEELSLDDNLIVDITPLKNKKELTSLSLHMNEVEDVTVLETLVNLQMLNLSYNHISNITPVMNLEDLMEFTIYEKHDARLIDYGLIDALIDKGVDVLYHG